MDNIFLPSWVICRCNLRSLFTSIKFYLTLTLIYIGLSISFGDLPSYLTHNNEQLQVFELYIYSCNVRISRWIIACGYILIISSIDCTAESTLLYLVRGKKRNWLNAQVFTIVITSLFYVVFLFVWTVLYAEGNVYLDNAWSLPITQASQEGGNSIGIRFGSYFPHYLLSCARPWAMMMVTALSMLAFFVVISILMLLFRLVTTDGISIAASIGLVLLDYFLLETAGFIPCYYAAFFISPFSLTDMVFTLSYNGNTNFALGYTVCYLGLIFLVVYILTYIRIKKHGLNY